MPIPRALKRGSNGPCALLSNHWATGDLFRRHWRSGYTSLHDFASDISNVSRGENTTSRVSRGRCPRTVLMSVPLSRCEAVPLSIFSRHRHRHHQS